MKETTLHAVHESHGAKLIEFGGWHMPVQYGPILDEAKCVRERAGLFDLGHMGRLSVNGPDHVAFLDRLATNHVAKIPVGAIRYSLFCKDDGNPIDDLLVYREENAVYLVVNASNTPAVLAWLEEHRSGFDVEIEDRTEREGMLAVQGPKAAGIVQRLVPDKDLSEIGYYRFGFGEVSGLPNTRLSRTGYTGEDGFEIYLPAGEAPRVFAELMEAGAPDGLEPIGLGARDILRLEAGMPLYGHEIDAEHNPIEAGLSFGVSFRKSKGDWIGREALDRVRKAPERKLIGLTTPGPRIPRQGAAVFAGDREVGTVCSGGKSPTLDTNIASALIRVEDAVAGAELEIDFRGKRQACVLQELPFFSRTRK